MAERAAGWDESVAEYLQRAQLYLSHQHPDSTYAFIADGENRKLSWTMEKHGTKLEGKWRCEKAKDDQRTSCEILNFLMDSNVKLSDEMLRKTQSFERMKLEAEKCLQQNEQFKDAKQQFEIDIFKKFIAVLNSKKAKLREVRDKLARLEPTTSAAHQDKESDLEDETDDDEGEDEDDESNDSKEKNEEGERHPLEVTNGDVVTDTTGARNMPTAGASDTKSSIPTTVTNTSRSQVAADTSQLEKPSNSGVIDSAAALLADSIYTSAPKRRRRL